VVSQPEIPFDPKSMPGHRSYFETLCRIVSLALEVLATDSCLDTADEESLQRVSAGSVVYTHGSHGHVTEMRLHSSYLLSVLCRVSLDPHVHLDAQRRTMIRED
jgi:hypothetical protein